MEAFSQEEYLLLNQVYDLFVWMKDQRTSCTQGAIQGMLRGEAVLNAMEKEFGDAIFSVSGTETNESTEEQRRRRKQIVHQTQTPFVILATRQYGRLWMREYRKRSGRPILKAGKDEAEGTSWKSTAEHRRIRGQQHKRSREEWQSDLEDTTDGEENLDVGEQAPAARSRRERQKRKTLRQQAAVSTQSPSQSHRLVEKELLQTLSNRPSKSDTTQNENGPPANKTSMTQLSKAPSRKISKSWEVTYQELETHCRKTPGGIASVSRSKWSSNRSLGEWLYNQKRQLMKNSSKVNVERRAKLAALGVRFLKAVQGADGQNGPPGVHSDELSWQERIYQLEAFHQAHKHVNFPSSYNTDLFQWLEYQRQELRDDPTFPSERRETLQGLGVQAALRVKSMLPPNGTTGPTVGQSAKPDDGDEDDGTAGGDPLFPSERRETLQGLEAQVALPVKSILTPNSTTGPTVGQSAKPDDGDDGTAGGDPVFPSERRETLQGLEARAALPVKSMLPPSNTTGPTVSQSAKPDDEDRTAGCDL